MNALKQRALAVLNDESLDAESRAIIRYGLETNDPWLADLVRRAEASESVADTFHCRQTPETNKIDSNSDEKIETLAEIICRAGDRSAAALFVLMGMLEDSTSPNVLAHTAKHLAFTRCGESNIFGMVDAQRAMIEGELLRL